MMMSRLPCTVLAMLGLAAFTGCDRGGSTAPTSTTAGDHAHTGDDRADADHAHTDDADDRSGHHGEPIELGTATIAGYAVRASRDAGEITPGGDAPIDVWLTGDLARIIAVRFWIGLDDATGSIKAKAEIENPDQPNHFHTHVEVPDPMPDGFRLWVELAIDGEGKKTGSFDLQTR